MGATSLSSSLSVYMYLCRSACAGRTLNMERCWQRSQLSQMNNAVREGSSAKWLVKPSVIKKLAGQVWCVQLRAAATDVVYKTQVNYCTVIGKHYYQ